jgi:isoleucyl-tRNA synthetase
MPVFSPVPERYDFPAEEAAIRRFWKEREIFRKSLELRAGAPPFVFYEGPPTANGKPHPGHVLTRVVKDLFPRYKTMQGFRVPRKAGWDTHGLPVEIEVEKELKISGKEEIEKYGVAAFANRCIESVFRYTKEWEELTERIGFWVDLSEAYVTFHQSYIESVWWSLRELFERGLLYEDRKIVWWWPQGGTTLSAAEVGLGYREVDDPSVYVRFRDASDGELSYLAWTTTPWTLPSNVALAVAPEGEYVEATLPLAGGGTERVVVAAALLERVLGAKKGKGAVKPLAVSAPFPGRELAGRRYRQLLPYARPQGGRSFEIVPADFVAIDPGAEAGSGTGLVHIAPAFGEDDYRLAREQGLGFLQLVDEKGRMTAEMEDFAGQFCKEADRGIIRLLASRGLLFKEEVYRHDYPFCWRSSSDPLIQYARPAWFIATSRFREALLRNNAAIRWFPEHIRDGRFGNFLENNVDWALSRERYWGTPLPIWRCEATGHLEAVGSYAELLAKPGLEGMGFWEDARRANPGLSEHLKVHKPYIDALTYRSPKDPSARMRRVPEVIDCWYDSGAMPFAQWGFPHEPGSVERFREAFPADFISEAIDQTRGWFYSLLAESTLIHQDRDPPHPYRACIVLGHVSDERGVKMAKSLRNYVAPGEVLDEHGADALRWYFLSQGHPWTNVRFSSNRVGEAKKDFLIRLQNVYSFFVIYAGIDGFDPAAGNPGASDLSPRTLARSRGYSPVASRSLMDRWILSELHQCAAAVAAALDGYDIYAASRSLFELVDRLSNWYVRRSRPRFWGSGLGRDKLDAHWTLYECLATLSRLIAPFTPFFAESLYQNLVAAPWKGSQPESVHLTEFPRAEPEYAGERLSKRMALALELVALGRAARVEAKLRVRQPLREAVVVLADPSRAAEIEDLLPLVEGELNVKRMRFAAEAEQYVHYRLKPNFKRIGPRLGPLVQKLKPALAGADAAHIKAALAERGFCELEVAGERVRLTPEEIEVEIEPAGGYTARAGSGMVLVLDTAVDEELRREWWVREVVAEVNSLRGERGLAYEARVELSVWCGAELEKALAAHLEYLKGETLASAVILRPLSEAPAGGGPAVSGDAGGEKFVLDFREASQAH